ncbi:hypothetical protein A3730_15140 [Alcanivorax sp. HI0044]|uniref:hypothetical protein n=4 Tax=unclassified Alcanivorax TaxID=2638842 RepID=UPI0007B9B4A0|nr:hypothetical protein [Alcanivorax sp. HI0044]KZY35212.1 hypothetical protein A3730_15140 [Alcanivorax sp. HI0044]
MRLKVMLLGSAFLAGCGGGGSDSDQVAQAYPEPAIFRAPLEPLPAATLTSEEDAVLLFGGGFYHTGSLSTIEGHANIQMGNGVDVASHHGFTCLQEGGYVSESYTLEDLESPFSGALYDVRSYRLEGCDYDLTLGSINTGFRQRGFPGSGIGSGEFFEETDFLSYDRYGDSVEIPYFAYQQTDIINSRLMRAMYGHVFIHLERESAEQEYGEKSQHSEEFLLERFASIDDDTGEVVAFYSQLGKNMDERFALAVTPNAGLPFPESRIESFSGVYGVKRVIPHRESCPEGLITAATLSDLVIEDDPSDTSFLSLRRAIKSGQVELQDESGNSAVITMDGNSEVWSVSLNGGASVDFSLEEIQDLREERCG